MKNEQKQQQFSFERPFMVFLFLSLWSFVPNLMAKEQNIYQFQVKKITGEALSLNSFMGRPLLIVNIATQCALPCS